MQCPRSDFTSRSRRCLQRGRRPLPRERKNGRQPAMIRASICPFSQRLLYSILDESLYHSGANAVRLTTLLIYSTRQWFHLSQRIVASVHSVQTPRNTPKNHCGPSTFSGTPYHSRSRGESFHHCSPMRA